MKGGTTALRVLVADDEAPARRWLGARLAREPGVEVVGECADGCATVAAARALLPDALFLDVRMPGLDGFEVLAELAEPPAIVFVSAHEGHAVRAFEVAAADYLLKPFDERRLRLALERVRAARTPGAQAAELVVAAAGGRVAFLRFAEIDWIEAAGNYLRLHAGAAVHLARGTLEALQPRAESHGFVRVHRSHLVRVAAIAALHPAGSGDLELVLRDGTRLRASRRQRAALEGLLAATRPGRGAGRPTDEPGTRTGG